MKALVLACLTDILGNEDSIIKGIFEEYVLKGI